MMPKTLTLREHMACRMAALATLPPPAGQRHYPRSRFPWRAGLLFVALVQLAAAENVTLCWGEMIGVKFPHVCMRAVLFLSTAQWVL